MKLAISNIAWDKSEDAAVFGLMLKYGFTGLEVAPGRVFEQPFEAAQKDITGFLLNISSYGIKPVAMQALLFGRPDLKIFGPEETRKQTLEYLKNVILFAQRLGIGALVFGSPKNRDTGGMEKTAAEKIAIFFFRELAVFAARHGAKVCIEPNPAIYGTDFINTTNEAALFVKSVNNSAFSIHIDTGAIIMNGEDPARSAGVLAPRSAHVHISEPGLDPVPQATSIEIHEKIASALRKNNYAGFVSIEMKKPDAVKRLETIEKALSFVREIYG